MVKILVTNSSRKYDITDAEWTTSTSKTMGVGDTPEMKVTLTPRDDGNDEYQFKGHLPFQQCQCPLR